MKRSSLFVCCGITLLYLSDRSDSRTVSPIVYLTTAIPNVAGPTGYNHGDGAGQSGYHNGGGVGGQSGYYGGGAGGQSGYYGGGVGGQSRNYGGGVDGQSRNYGGGGGPTGHYGGRSPTAAATMYGSYGHRTMPESAVRGAIRPVRDERSYALYESPNTYEYMTNPPRKSGKVSRVPETERLPPGDDVEFIDDGGGGGDRRPAKDRRRDGDEGSRDVDDRPRGYQLQDNNDNSKRANRNKPKAKGGRRVPAPEDDYANDGGDASGGGRGGGDAEPVGSSTAGDVREGVTAKKPRRDGREEVARKNKNHGPGGDVPVKHKIHKKNEYSKRQQFFDEEHVDHGKKKPKNTANRDVRKDDRGHELRKQSKKKKKQQQQHHHQKQQQHHHQKQQQPQQQQQQKQQQPRPAQKPVRRTTKREKKDDRGTSRLVPQGYGQVVAVR